MQTAYGNQPLARAAALLIAILCGFIGEAPAAEPPAAAEPAAASAAPADWHVTVRDLAAKHFKNPA